MAIRRSARTLAGPRVLAVANQKGGVGKTTTAINLGTALAAIGELGAGGRSRSAGQRLDRARHSAQTPASTTSYDVLDGPRDARRGRGRDRGARASTSCRPTPIWSASRPICNGRCQPALRLRDAVTALSATRSARPYAGEAFTYVLIDCPPSLNILTLNAMSAAHAVLVPVQCEFFALEGISQLKDTIDQIRGSLNPGLEIQGVVLTMHDARLTLSKEVAQEVRAFFGPKVYETMIPRNVRVAEAPSHGKPILLYDYDSAGSQAYVRLATEIIERERRYKAA